MSSIITFQDAVNAPFPLTERALPPAYMWDFADSNGEAVPNLGTAAIGARVPTVQLLGGAQLLWDRDGGTSNTRTVWPAGVPNSLGNDECVNFTFTSASQRFTMFYRPDYNGAGLTPQDVTFDVSLRVADGSTAQPMILGSSSDAIGPKTAFTPTGAFEAQTVDIPDVDGTALPSYELRPAATGVSYPFTVTIERATARPSGQPLQTMAALKATALRGHLKPSFTSPNCINVVDGKFIPTAKAPNLLADLPGNEDVTELRMSCYIDLTDQAYVQNIVYPMAYLREANPGGNLYTNGALAIDTSVTNSEYDGRFTPYAGGMNNMGLQFAADTILRGGGMRRIDVVLAGDAANARMNNNLAVGGGKRFMMYVDGIPQSDYPTTAMPAGFRPRQLSIGGIQPAATRANALVATSGNVNSPEAVPRYDYNMGVTTSAEILAEMQDDIARSRVVLPPPTLHVMLEGDSTSRFTGAASHWYARQLAGVGRMFTNMSSGGAFYDPSPETSAAFNHPDRIEYRKDVLRANKARAYPLGIYGYHGGENGTTHYAVPATGYAQIVAMMIAEVNEIGTAPGCKLTTFITTVRPSGAAADAGKANKDALNAFLRSRFSTATSVPYLFINPLWTEGGDEFKYLIDLDAWAPRHPDYGLTYTSWTDLLLNDTGPGKNNKVLSGDYQHWAGTDGGKYGALDVFTPSLTEIAFLESGMVL